MMSLRSNQGVRVSKGMAEPLGQARQVKVPATPAAGREVTGEQARSVLSPSGHRGRSVQVKTSLEVISDVRSSDAVNSSIWLTSPGLVPAVSWFTCT